MEDSTQIFNAEINGNAKCAGHSECDAIIMDNAKISAIPKITANNTDAALIHEAAIGKIAGESPFRRFATITSAFAASSSKNEQWLWQIKDVWITPMSLEETRFRFFRWQKGRILEADHQEALLLLSFTFSWMPFLSLYQTRFGT